MNTYERISTHIGYYQITRITKNADGSKTITEIKRWYANVEDTVTVKTVR